MPRAALTTLAPMLAAAAFALWGGERLARHQVEEREPADRVRLIDFSTGLTNELDRLEKLYQGHISDLLSLTYDTALRTQLTRRCEGTVGVRTLIVFGPGGKRVTEVSGMRSPRFGMRVPDVELGDTRFASARNVIALPKPPDYPAQGPSSGWVEGADGIHRLYWQRLGVNLAAIVIDDSELQDCISTHLRQWGAAPFAPLTETRQLAAVYCPRSTTLFSPPETAGPAALLIPHRTMLGEWQVQAWDRLKVHQEHDRGILTLACGIASLMVLAGIYLTIVQNRALRLAEERVSFVNRVSHELGTPLTNILLNLELAQRSAGNRPEDSRRRLRLVDEEVRRLARLVSNVLTFSRSERKTLELRTSYFVPDEMVADVIAQFEPSLERAGIRVEFERGATGNFHGDPDAFAQIAGNLISNVEKYAATGGWIGISTSLSGERLSLRVADAGPGIPRHARERIFEPFERVSDGLAEGSSGTGLGLAIARDLAARMGGTLLLETSEHGAVFVLDLPASSQLKLVPSSAA